MRGAVLRRQSRDRRRAACAIGSAAQVLQLALVAVGDARLVESPAQGRAVEFGLVAEQDGYLRLGCPRADHLLDPAVTDAASSLFVGRAHDLDAAVIACEECFRDDRCGSMTATMRFCMRRRRGSDRQFWYRLRGRALKSAA